MAEDKKSVLLYCDIIHTVEKLDDETAGALFKHYLRYVNDMNPETNNLLVEISFEPIKQNLKRDLKKWEEIKLKRSKAGLKSAEVRSKKKQDLTNSTSVKCVEKNLTNPTVRVNGNVTVNDNVKESDIKNAHDFLKENCSIKIEELEMKYSGQIKDWPELVEYFNLKVDEEELKWEPKILLSRFQRLCINWIKFSAKNKSKSNSGPNKKSRLDEFLNS